MLVAISLLNKDGYFFDGDSSNRIKKINWKTNKFLNSKKTVTFDKINADFEYEIRSSNHIILEIINITYIHLMRYSIMAEM